MRVRVRVMVRVRVRVRVRGRVRVHRRLGELLPEVVDDEGRRGEDDPVGAQAAHDDHALQLRAPVLPFAGQAGDGSLRLGVAVPG